MVSKKGVSDIVSTVLIVLLVVAAVAIIGTIILRTTNSASKTVQSTLNCQELQLLPTSCTYTTDAKLPTVLIQRKAGGEKLNVTGISVIFTEGVATETRNPTTFPNVLETKSYVVGTTLGTTALTNGATSVAVSAMVKDSATACPLSPSVSCVLVKKSNGQGCTLANECESSYCNGYNRCSSKNVGAECISVADCNSALYCQTVNNVCSAGNIGDICDANNQCQSNNCNMSALPDPKCIAFTSSLIKYNVPANVAYPNVVWSAWPGATYYRVYGAPLSNASAFVNYINTTNTSAPVQTYNFFRVDAWS